MEGTIDQQRAALGERRMAEFWNLLAQATYNIQFVIQAVTAGRAAGYSDEYLMTLRKDAWDIRQSSDALASFVERLADEWKQQRETNPQWPVLNSATDRRVEVGCFGRRWGIEFSEDGDPSFVELGDSATGGKDGPT